jgi:LacI family transcriptional regulator
LASLRDIAEKLNVSVSLVSKVLSGRLGTTGVSDEAVANIRRVAEQLGYRKNASAVALLSGRHNIIGVFIHRLGMAGSGIIEELLEGVSAVALQHHQRLQLNFFITNEEFFALCHGANRGTMDGLVVGGVYHAELEEHLRAIHGAGLPLVTLYDTPVAQPIPNVGFDQTAASRLATEHLISRGARKLAHIRNMDGRYEGYRQALAAAGLRYDAARVFQAREHDYSHVMGEEAVRKFLKNGVAFDGLVAQSDQEAVGAMNELFRRGFRVPEDVRLIGIDNAPYCEFARVPLSSVSQDFLARGAASMRLVLDLVEGRDVRSTHVQPILFPRDSSR